MPDRPLLRLPEAIEAPKKPGPRFIDKVTRPSPARQGERLGPRFDRLMGIADNRQALMELRDDPASIAPERAIVFELAGSLKDFYAQARALGLEYLGDFEDEIDADDDFYDQEKPEKRIAGRIYLAMPDLRALQELLSLWGRYQVDGRLPYGWGQWEELFSRLVDIRPWGPQDRVPPETISFWKSALESHPREPVRFEIELWFFGTAQRRAQAFSRLAGEIETLAGRIVDHTVIPEVRYDAALVDIPPDRVQQLIDHPNVTLARTDEIMFLRPQSVARQQTRDELEGEEATTSPTGTEILKREPIVALLDGLPIQNHARLAGRLVVDDPEGLESSYPVDRREHGTGMASLIIHGDLNRSELPIPLPLFVLPVMQPNPGGGDERTPQDRLLVDVIYRAVRRIKEGDGSEPALAPSVVVVNLSIGDEWRPFAGVMSPLGRLLDYLSYRYRLLFIVSAGNVLDRLVVPAFKTSLEFENATPEDREKAILAAINDHKSQRTLFSPAEALNVLTIGAAHAGSAFSGSFPGNLIDPYTDGDLPNIASAMGLGFRKTIKPDLLVEGGRTPVRIVGSGESVAVQPARSPARHFGARVAAPDRRGGVRYEDFIWGSSVSAALATRAAHRIHDVLMDSDGGTNHADIPPNLMPLILKALLVHGASWGAKGRMLDAFFGPQGKGAHVQRRDDIARLLGYGVPNFDRVLDCTENRATLLGTGTIAGDSGLIYRIPVPADLNGARALRALTVTLAWFSPVNARHQGYRMAALDVSPGSEEKYWIVADREKCQPSDKSVTRGTVFHERRSGEKAAVFLDGGNLLLKVSCRAPAGDLNEEIPFALAVSFEVAIDSGIQVYDQIRARLVAPVRPGVGSDT